MLKLFLLPIISAVLIHLFKLLIDLYKKRFSWHKAFGYGGMPSSHAALVTSLATCIYLAEGLSSAFAISLIFMLIVLRDALGLRGYLSEHARVLNKLIKDLPDEAEYKYPILEERIAHTWQQIAIGAILGFVLTLLFF